MLISIISDTYGRFSAIKNSTAFKEKVYMMTLMQDSIFGKFINSKPDHNELLFIAKVIDKSEKTNKDEAISVQMINKLYQISTAIETINQKL